MNNIIIEAFKGDQRAMDEIAIKHLKIRRWQEATGQNKFRDIYDSQNDLKNIYSYYINGGGMFLVARDIVTNEVVGFVALKNEGDGYGVGKRLAVLPEYQKQGIATRLLDELKQWALENNYIRFTLSTNTGEKALTLYKKLGCESYGFDDENQDYLMKLEWESNNMEESA